MQGNSWGPQDDQGMGPGGNVQPANGASIPADDRNAGQDPESAEYTRGSSVGDTSVSGNKGDSFREKQVKPNKVYIGGLPEHTRQEDLQSCFGKIGIIVNIELKVGYGFVEFETREAAEESVHKYHEGYFMGNKIRVELSHGGGRTAKYSGDPGACFKCGQMGHWARECPTHPLLGQPRRTHYESPLIDRIQRDYVPHPSRGPPQPREEVGPPRLPPPRDARYDYPPAPPRDFRRASSPRGYREYPPPQDRARDYDDFRRPPVHERERFAVPPPAEMRSRYPPPDPSYRGYGGPLPPPTVAYDRYDRRPVERYPPSYPPPPGVRARTPPRMREEFERPPPVREYPEYRGRPLSPPPRYAEYPRISAEPPAPRYRRRSESPPRAPASYDPYTNNGYQSGPAPQGPQIRIGSRDYPRMAREPVDNIGGYRRS